MSEIEYKIGDIVRCGTRTMDIKEIENRIIKTIWGEYSIDDIEPIEIGSGYDSDITLKSHNPIKASYVGPNDPIPVHRDYYFMQYEIDGIKIADVVNDNHIKYVHELQKWLAINMPNEYLDI